MFLSFFSLQNIKFFFFWGFWSLQKIKLKLFEVFLYIKETTSSTVWMEFRSQFKNKMETTTTTKSAFFLRMADLDTIFTTHTVSRNMPKTGKKSNFEEISSSKTRKSYVFIFFSQFNMQQYTRIGVSLWFSLKHGKGTSP